MIRQNDRYIQVGVTSFGLDCDFKEFAPDVFTRLSTYKKWIEKTSSGEVNIINVGKDTYMTEEQKKRRKLYRRTIWLAVGGGILLLLLITLGCGAYCYVKWRDSTGRIR